MNVSAGRHGVDQRVKVSLCLTEKHDKFQEQLVTYSHLDDAVYHVFIYHKKTKQTKQKQKTKRDN
jgi:hypothetical protein